MTDKLQELVSIYRRQQEEHGGCGDSGCVVYNTNGGCRCFENWRIRQMFMTARKIMDELDPPVDPHSRSHKTETAQRAPAWLQDARQRGEALETAHHPHPTRYIARISTVYHPHAHPACC